VATALVIALALGGCEDDGGDDGVAMTFGTLPTATSTGPPDGDDTSSAETGPAGTGSTAPVDTGAGGFPVCEFSCVADADCTINGGEDIGFGCVDGTCTLPCVSDDSCLAWLSFWTIEPCITNPDCGTNKCIPYDGLAGCGFGPDDAACAEFDMVEIQRPDVTGASITVCAQPGAACGTDGACFIPCDATSCGPLTCGASGDCECTDDLQCVMAQAGERCTAAGTCAFACVTEADCPASGFDATVTSCQ
jgi:hypothetical protein